MNVRRSFSCDTALAADSAAKKTVSMSWTNAMIWNRSSPNDAVSPRVASRENPTVACHVVTPRMPSTPTRAARAA